MYPHPCRMPTRPYGSHAQALSRRTTRRCGRCGYGGSGPPKPPTPRIRPAPAPRYAVPHQGRSTLGRQGSRTGVGVAHGGRTAGSAPQCFAFVSCRGRCTKPNWTGNPTRRQILRPLGFACGSFACLSSRRAARPPGHSNTVGRIRASCRPVRPRSSSHSITSRSLARGMGKRGLRPTSRSRSGKLLRVGCQHRDRPGTGKRYGPCAPRPRCEPMRPPFPQEEQNLRRYRTPLISCRHRSRRRLLSSRERIRHERARDEHAADDVRGISTPCQD